MFSNRITGQFLPNPSPPVAAPTATSVAQVSQLLPTISTHDLYQMAAAKARYDYELDRLFNPEFYNNGSGI